MKDLIQLKKIEAPVLKKLLEDKTTGKNIIWATDTYKELGPGYESDSQIRLDHIQQKDIIKPRIQKALEIQRQRTRKSAEVYTPSWICNRMNHQFDLYWIFKEMKPKYSLEKSNISDDKAINQIISSANWKEYIQRKVLEITCGEAPFLTSRYDPASGEPIEVEDRIGLLDRKIKVITGNVKTYKEWMDFLFKALKSIYGYEFQGDSLLVGRINIYLSVLETIKYIWKREPEDKDKLEIANIISWNIFQMDGLTDNIPLGVLIQPNRQLNLFDFGLEDLEQNTPTKDVENVAESFVQIKLWGKDGKVSIKEMKAGKTMTKKFGVVVGNPPYQEETTEKDGNNRQKPSKSIFQLFQTAADQLAETSSVLIYPGKRWMHQSGKGMKEFGKEQLNDPHLSSIDYFPNAQDVFKGSGINDGITIVTKVYSKETPGFEYNYIKDGRKKTVYYDNPGENLIVLNPEDKAIATKLERGTEKLGLTFLHNRILPRSLFGVESDWIEKNPTKAELYRSDKDYSWDNLCKLYANDQSGSRGRTKLYVTDRSNIKNNQYIDQWQVVAISANPGGQRRDNQLQIIDNHTAFGRAKVGLGSFTSKEEAENFFKYMSSNFVKFALLLSDENLTSLAKMVPDLGDYSSSCKLVNFSKPLDPQLYQLFNLEEDEIQYIESLINDREEKRKKNDSGN